MPTTETAAASVALAATPAPAPTAEAGLTQWYDYHIRDSLFSRDTSLHNRVAALIAEIKTLLSQKSPTPTETK